MPKLNSSRWVHLIAAHRTYRGDMRKLAAVTGIPYGTLRNAIQGRDEMRLGRIYEVADALGVPEKSVPDLIAGQPTPSSDTDLSEAS